MSLAQENFERATLSASKTLKHLYGTHPAQIDLSKESPKTLQTWAWDLEAIQAALRLELMNRETKSPMDFG